MGKRAKTQQAGGRTGRILGRLGLLAAETLLLAFAALCTLSFALAKGPSPTAAQEFVLTVRETGALRFLAGWFFSDEEIAQMEAGKNAAVYAEIDTGLIRISADPSEPDAWGLVDEDGDGIVWEEIQGKGFKGCMMVVREPSRVVLGFRPDESGTVGQTARYYDAVAGVKAGGTPDMLVVFQGAIFFEHSGTGSGFAGFDGDCILHVGRMTAEALSFAAHADVVVVESNYDREMLMGGSYPYDLKMRISQGSGHLSNEECAGAVRRFYHKSLTHLFLCHLSENNNTPQLAYKATSDALADIGLLPSYEGSSLFASEEGDRVIMQPLPRRSPSRLFTLREEE